LLDRGRRGKSTVIAIEIHTTLSALHPFVFICFRRRRENKNTRRGEPYLKFGRGNGN
jgi:hypothetical protein